MLSNVIIVKITAGIGKISNITASHKKLKDWGKLIMGHPLVITAANPLAIAKVPRVMTKGGTCNLLTKIP